MTEAHESSCVSADGAHDTLSPRHAPVTGHMPLLRPLPASAPGHQPPVVTSTRCVVSISPVSPVSPDSGHCHQSLTARHNTRVDTDQYPQCQCSRGTPQAPQAGLPLVPYCLFSPLIGWLCEAVCERLTRPQCRQRTTGPSPVPASTLSCSTSTSRTRRMRHPWRWP